MEKKIQSYLQKNEKQKQNKTITKNIKIVPMQQDLYHTSVSPIYWACLKSENAHIFVKPLETVWLEVQNNKN